MKIGQKLILSFISIALLVGVVGYISANTARKALQECIGEDSVVFAAETLDKIDRELCHKIEVLKVYSNDLVLNELLTKSNRKFERLSNVDDYINQKDKEWVSAPEATLTPFMEELTSNKLAVELKKITEFYAGEYGHEIFPEIFVTNKYGAVIASTGRTSDYFQADEQWYQKTTAEKTFWVGDIEYDESADAYACDIVVNLYDSRGNFSGIIKGVLDVEELIHVIEKIKATEENETTEFKLITKDGRLIYATEDFIFLEDVSDGLLSIVEQKAKQPGYLIAEGDRPGEGEELFAYAYSVGYGDYKGLGWILIVEHETEEIFAPVAELSKNIIIVSLTAIILAVLAGILLSRSISTPIEKLKNATVKIGKGKLDTKVEIESNDEIGELAASFRKMTEDLKETTTSIDNLNAANQQLQASEQQLKANEQQLRALNHHLTKRSKELDCLYRISELIMEVDKSMDDIFTEAVNYIPPAWQYPEITCAKISIKGREYVTNSFKESEWKMSSDIVTSQGEIGFIEVYYLEEKPVIYEGPFLKEERGLIDALCRQMASIYKRKQAEQSLKISNRDLTDFVHIASHDLKEPSRKVYSFGQLLAESVEGKLNGEEQENLDFMVDGAKRMQEMVESLLVYSRATTKDVVFEEIDLNEMIEQLKGLELANNLEEIKGSVLVPEPLPSINGDHSQIRQLLQNFIANALKYHREDVLPEVTVRALSQDGMVRIEVEDNGIGIEEKHYNNIFVMFRRLHSRQEYDGTGIGLSVCKKIVERHNGEIGVSSSYGQGSTFWFTVPAAKTAGREQEQLVSTFVT